MQGFFASFAGKQIESFAAATYNDSMVENIKQIIAEASRELFNSNGYQKVTMRQIADRCGISVGNLTYHYPHKEDLLMLEHDGILNAFLDDVLTNRPELTGLKGYFTVECAFLYRILNDPPVAALYADVINVSPQALPRCALSALSAFLSGSRRNTGSMDLDACHVCAGI